jgi:hypothetical protein
MHERSKRVAKKALKHWPLIPAVVLGAVGADAKPPAPPKPTKPPPPPAPTTVPLPAVPKFKDTNVLKIQELSLSPSLPKEGETVTVTLRLRNESPVQLAKVEWSLSGASRKTGTITSIPAKSSKVVTHTFTAPSGNLSITATVDAQRKIPEPAELRKNNSVTIETTTSTATGDWGIWSRSAADLVGQEIDLCKAETSVAGVVNATNLTVTKLIVGSIDQNKMKSLLTGATIPDDVARAFSQALYATFAEWANNYTASVPNAFPAFGAFPGPVAPPMPSIPFPLVIGTSVKSAKALLPASIEALVLKRLSKTRRAQAGASVAVKDFARAASGRLNAWLVVQQATQVMGRGPVPTFAPPYVPVGPVIQGDVVAATTHFF